MNTEEKNTTKEIVKKNKSMAKAAGLNSTFVIKDELLMTSFGKGNKAISEKKVTAEGILSLNAIPQFELTKPTHEFEVRGRGNTKGNVTDPRTSYSPGMDELRLKPTLEEKYFGTKFEDNIHIQLIYSILDIEKILAVHINNIIYELNNLRRVNKNAEHDDFVGYLSARNDFDTFSNPEKNIPLNNPKRDGIIRNIRNSKETFDNLLANHRLEYFGVEFEAPKGRKTPPAVQENYQKKMFAVFSLLGQLRQFCAHSEYYTRDWLYNIETTQPQILAELSKIYDKAIRGINDGFLKNNKKNLYIIKDMYKPADMTKYIQRLYDFTVNKEYKYLGFSIKKLRENMLEIPAANKMKDTSYDSVRHKLNLLLDFAIYMYYLDDANGKIEENVATLRATLNEEEKDAFYVKEAAILWEAIKDIVEKAILPNLKAGAINDRDKVYNVTGAEKIQMIGSNSSYFSKLIYLVTLFLDGKEINDLLTTLIKKFDGIQSFIDVLQDNNLPCEFSPNYKMFANCGEISKELRAINSFARMQKPTANAKKIMYTEAAQILGYKLSEKELEEMLEKMLQTEKIKKDGKWVSKRGGHDFRNFIASNVIESSRFKYLIRYANPLHVREIANNKDVIYFVLKGIPEKQIDRYYSSCKGKYTESLDEKIKFLADIITGIDFEDFKNVKQRTMDARQAEFKAQKQAVITLYLTVMYLLTKNLVYVNARYFLGFHCLERDSALFFKKEWAAIGDYYALTKHFIENPDPCKANRNKTYLSGYPKNARYINDRFCNILAQNIAESDDSFIKYYRNNAAHLGAVRNMHLYIDDVEKIESYFALYHYVTQRSLEASYEHYKNTVMKKGGTLPELKDSTKGFWEKLHKYNTYCKDFVKVLNVPFGYKLSRYKKLSIDALFDRNNEQKEEKGEWTKE